MIAAYLDRMLPDAQRERIAEHIGSCETCCFLFTEAAQTQVYEAGRRNGAAQDSVYDRSRFTVDGENAGVQTAMYSAPSGPGVL